VTKCDEVFLGYQPHHADDRDRYFKFSSVCHTQSSVLTYLWLF